jgi:hypothetical protein
VSVKLPGEGCRTFSLILSETDRGFRCHWLISHHVMRVLFQCRVPRLLIDCPQSKIVSRFESINPISPRTGRAETRRNFSKANADNPRVSPSSFNSKSSSLPCMSRSRVEGSVEVAMTYFCLTFCLATWHWSVSRFLYVAPAFLQASPASRSVFSGFCEVRISTEDYPWGCRCRRAAGPDYRVWPSPFHFLRA